jgi:flavin-dependent dehydrogenase
MRPDNETAVDAAVIGGGPAGATAARLLGAWGHSVALLARPAGPRPPLAESLPPSTRKVLAAVGVLGSVEEAGFLATTGNTSWWGSAEPRVEVFAGGPGAHGWQVLRADLEALLLRAAADSGVRVRADARVRRVTFEAPDEVRLDAETKGTEPAGLSARFVLDASGRAGVVARQGWREPHGPITLAVSAVWHRPGGFSVPDDTHTLVEAYGDGWVWSVPVAPGLRHVTVMVDPGDRHEERRRLPALYHDELSKTGHLRAILEGATERVPPWAADASTYTARAFAGPGFALVGDAASFIDPLSSYGVKKALASAWLAAVATNTALRHPERSAMALSFYSRREEQMQTRYAREAARYATEAAARYPASRFWTERAQAPVRPQAGILEDDDGIAADADVRAAFEKLKSRSWLRLRLAASARHEPRPAVDGHEIVTLPALVGPAGNAIHFACGVHASSLAELAPAAVQVPDLWAAYNREAGARALPEVALPDFLRGLSTLLAAGFLEDD